MQISIPSMQIWQKNRNFSNSSWRTDAILKIVFRLYLGAILADLYKFRNGDEESHAHIGHLTKTAIFANSRWQTAAILKIALPPHLSRELSDFDQIWYTQMQISIPSREIRQIIEIFQIQDGGRTPYLKSFLAISGRLIGRSTRNSERRWRITCQYRSRDQNCNFSKIQDGGRPPFWKQFLVFTSFL